MESKQSNGEIPKTFLRGAGLPEQFIIYLKSRAGTALDFCPVSTATRPKTRNLPTGCMLTFKTTECAAWFAPHDIQGGKKIHDQIDEALRVYDRLLLILSEHSMKSLWVKTEIANAREKESREGRQVLFPVGLVPYEKIRAWKLFDADLGDDSTREVREYFIPDFSNWTDHQSITERFEVVRFEPNGKANRSVKMALADTLIRSNVS